MPQTSLTKSVIKYLKRKNFKYIRSLGEGAFGAVISMLTPDKNEVAIKIVQKSDVWEIEDQYWPILEHENILALTNTMIINELDVKLYFMPILSKDLCFAVTEKRFKKDPNSLNRVKKWFREILAATEYLHNNGLCHLDIKMDNVLLDEEDNAILCDFSGLNFADVTLERVVAPTVFWPKECLTSRGEMKFQGKHFDMWCFGLLALNVLTGHKWLLTKFNEIGKLQPDWERDVWPILKTGLRKTKFKGLMKTAFPKASLSDREINEALHFVRFIMKIDPEKRPTASRVKKHPFLKTSSNPFLKELNEQLNKQTDSINPFRRVMNATDPQNQADIEESAIIIPATNQQGIISDQDHFSNTDTCTNSHQRVQDTYACGDAPVTKNNEAFGGNMLSWFRKKFNSVFKGKK